MRHFINWTKKLLLICAVYLIFQPISTFSILVTHSFKTFANLLRFKKVEKIARKVHTPKQNEREEKLLAVQRRCQMFFG